MPPVRYVPCLTKVSPQIVGGQTLLNWCVLIILHSAFTYMNSHAILSLKYTINPKCFPPAAPYTDSNEVLALVTKQVGSG